MTMKAGDNKHNLKRLRELEDDWDGQGAAAPKPEVLDLVEELCDIFDRHNMWACAAPDGSICVENSAGLMIDIEYCP